MNAVKAAPSKQTVRPQKPSLGWRLAMAILGGAFG